jgi:hypothetical protein
MTRDIFPVPAPGTVPRHAGHGGLSLRAPQARSR